MFCNKKMYLEGFQVLMIIFLTKSCFRSFEDLLKYISTIDLRNKFLVGSPQKTCFCPTGDQKVTDISATIFFCVFPIPFVNLYHKENRRIKKYKNRRPDYCIILLVLIL